MADLGQLLLEAADCGTRCPGCGHVLRWHENLPLLGWIVGEVIVTAGVQALHPGQKVRLLGSEP